MSGNPNCSQGYRMKAPLGKRKGKSWLWTLLKAIVIQGSHALTGCRTVLIVNTTEICWRTDERKGARACSWMKLPGLHTWRQITSKVNAPFIQLVCIPLSEWTTVCFSIHLLYGVDEVLSKCVLLTWVWSCEGPLCCWWVGMARPSPGQAQELQRPSVDGTEDWPLDTTKCMQKLSTTASSPR